MVNEESNLKRYYKRGSKLDPNLEEITRIFDGSTKSVRIIMVKFGVSESMIYPYLAKKGLRLTRVDRPWTKEEDEKLINHLSQYDELTTAQKLNRTKSSIRNRIRRLHLTALQVRSEWYTGTEVAYIMGISMGTLKTRIESGNLEARRNNDIDLPNSRWFITRKNLADYITKYSLELVGKKFDAVVVVDLLTDRSLVK